MVRDLWCGAVLREAQASRRRGSPGRSVSRGRRAREEARQLCAVGGRRDRGTRYHYAKSNNSKVICWDIIVYELLYNTYRWSKKSFLNEIKWKVMVLGQIKLFKGGNNLINDFGKWTTNRFAWASRGFLAAHSVSWHYWQVRIKIRTIVPILIYFSAT